MLGAKGIGIDLHYPSIQIANRIFKNKDLIFTNKKVDIRYLKNINLKSGLLLSSSFLVYLNSSLRRKLLQYCIENSIDIICVERYEPSLAKDLDFFNIKYNIAEKPRKIIKFYFQANFYRKSNT